MDWTLRPICLCAPQSRAAADRAGLCAPALRLDANMHRGHSSGRAPRACAAADRARHRTRLVVHSLGGAPRACARGSFAATKRASRSAAARLRARAPGPVMAAITSVAADGRDPHPDRRPLIPSIAAITIDPAGRSPAAELGRYVATARDCKLGLDGAPVLLPCANVTHRG
jgi:hypothetical protein